MKTSRMILVATALAAVAASSSATPALTRLVGSGDKLWQQATVSPLVLAASPHVAGEYVAFFAEAILDNEFVFGVWLFDGAEFHRVVDSLMPEGQAGVLTNRIFSIDETGLVAVNVEAYAMLGWKNGVLFPIALVGATPPNGPPGSGFVSFSHPVIKTGVVYFLGRLSNVPQEEAVRPYAWSEDLGLRELELPGLCCSSFLAPADGGAFIGATDPLNQFEEAAIWFRAADGTLQEYFRFTSPFPGAPPGATWFTTVKQLGVVSDAVVLNAEDSFGTISGLFRVSPTLVEAVMVSGDPVPSTGEPLATVLREHSSSGDRIAFIGVTNLPGCACDLIVQEQDRSLRLILAVGDLLGGVPVGFFRITYGALSGDRLVFDAIRTGDQAVWLADLSEPPDLEVPTLGSIGVAVLCALLALLGIVHLQHRGRQ